MSYNKETGMYEGYIYKIVNDVNNKVYIGQTKQTVEKRWSGHLSNCKRKDDNMFIHKAMNKYGIENFHIVQLAMIQNESEKDLSKQLNEIEKLYIQLYSSMVTNNGYNIDKGGSSSSHFQKEICKYNLDGKLLCQYNSIKEAAICMNCSESTISEVCTGRVWMALGYIWRFKEDDFYKYPTYPTSKRPKNEVHAKYYGIKVNCYTLNNQFVCTYNSLEEARIACCLKNSYNITNVCKKKRNKAGGYKWFYTNDPTQPDKTKIIA